jgi:outer membrane protein assembly factor BamD
MKIKGLCLLLLSLFLFACSTAILNPAEKYHEMNEQQLFNSALISMDKNSYNDAIDKFESLDARYPFGDTAEKAQLYAIYAYFKSGNYAVALAATERYIHLHPDSTRVDYAYFMKGVLNYEQNQGVFERYFSFSDLTERDLTAAKQSFLDFKVLVMSYPDSAYTMAAIEYMAYLRNLMADQEVAIAQYYYDRRAYVASINRANEVVLHYQGAPAMPDALLVAAQAYDALGLDDLAAMYYQVLAFNFPDSNQLTQLSDMDLSPPE